ncbi:MAG: TolC family protein [Thermodesulfobacteriota bacterium]
MEEKPFQRRWKKAPRAGRALFFCLALLIAALWAGNAPAAAKKVALLSDGESPALASLARQVETSARALAGDDAELSFKHSPAGRTREGARKALRAAAEDKATNAVVALGNIVSAEALGMGPQMGKPLVAVFLLDPELVRPGADHAPPGLATAGAEGRVGADLAAFAGMLGAQRESVLILADRTLLEAFPEVAERLSAAAGKQGMSARIRPLSPDAEAGLAELGQDVRAVYVCPGHALAGERRAAFYKALSARGVWAFSGEGRPDVEAGALAGQWPDLTERLARHAALCLTQFLENPKSAKVSGVFTPSPRLAIDESAAAAVGYTVSWKTAEEADVVAPGRPAALGLPAGASSMDLPVSVALAGGEPLSLQSAVERAVQKNAGLKSSMAGVEVKRQEKNLVLTQLLPQVEGQAGYVRVDENQAQRSMEFTPLWQTTAGVNLSQVLFSDPVISGLRAAGRVVEAASLSLEATKLDIAFAAAGLYLDCLEAGSGLAIAQLNLDLTEENLATARERVAAGSAGQQEVFRWEARKAQAQRDVLAARAGWENALMALNVIMGEEDLATRWTLSDVRASGGPFSVDGFSALAARPEGFASFTSRMIRNARSASPELSALEKALEGERIMQGQHKRRPYVPDAVAQFDYYHIMELEYDDFQGMAFPLPEDSDNHWSLSLNLVWPLFSGGAEVVNARKSSAAIRQMEDMRTETGRQVEQRMRAAIIATAQACEGISLARKAAEAAERNFQATREDYGQGVISILLLLDAQDEMVLQKREALFAEYEYVRALKGMERAAGGAAALSGNEESAAGMGGRGVEPAPGSGATKEEEQAR